MVPLRRLISSQGFWFKVIFFTLLIAPQFWFSHNLYLLGDDDTGLSYLNPVGAVKQFSSIWYSADSIASAGPLVGSEFVFSVVLAVLRIITLGLVNIQQLALGIILAASFYYSVRLLRIMSSNTSPVYYIAGLFYSLSTYFVLTEYYYLLPSTYVIILAPLFAYSLLKAIQERSIRPLLVSAIWGAVLSRAILTPVFINYLLFLGIFALLLGYCNGGVRLLARSVVTFFKMGLLLVLINAILLLPIVSLVFINRSNNSLTTDIQYRGSNLISTTKEFEFSEINKSKVSDVLLNIFPESISQQQGFGNHYLYQKYYSGRQNIIILLVILACCGLLFLSRRERILILSVVTMVIVSFIFLTVDTVPVFKQVYIYFINHLPLFSMNRYPSLKFHIPFVLFYSLFVGMGLQSLYTRVPQRVGSILLLLCGLSVWFVGHPLLSGKIMYDPNDKEHHTRSLALNADYNQLVRQLPKIIHEDTSFLLFPIGYGYGSFIQGSNDQEVYRSTITGFKNATGYDLFGNLKVINTPLDPSVQERANKYFYEHDVASLWSLAEELNIRYIIYAKQTDWLNRYSEIIPQDTYASENYYAPVDTTMPVYENQGYVVYKMKNAEQISRFTVGQSTTDVQFIKDADYLYRLRITTDSTDNLVMHSGFSQGWRLVPIAKEEYYCSQISSSAAQTASVKECDDRPNNISAFTSVWSYFGRRELSANHRSNDGFTNAWTINTNKAEQYYAVVFDSQYIFIFGGTVSFLVLIVYVILLFVKRKSTIVLTTTPDGGKLTK